MAKTVIKLTESDLHDVIKDSVNTIVEGIDINPDVVPPIVGFNPTHQKYVNTNDPWNPHPFYNEVRGYKVISIFKREMTDDKQDGNPLIWALKGRKWKFRNPHYDLMALLRRFVAVTKELKENFDVIITTPSSNQLNNEVFERVKRIIPHENAFDGFFSKYEANWVYEMMLDSTWLEDTYGEERGAEVLGKIYNAILMMNKKNDGVFSYKYLPKELREAIIQSMTVSDEYKNDLEYGPCINGKNVLILDDTVTSGKTISDSANAILDTFDPNNITFLTLFTPLMQTDEQS